MQHQAALPRSSPALHCMEMAAPFRSSQRNKKPCHGEGEDECTALAPRKKTFAVEMTHSFHPKARREKPAPSCTSLHPTPVLCRSISPTHTSLLLHQLPWMAPEPGFWVFFKVDVSFFQCNAHFPVKKQVSTATVLSLRETHDGCETPAWRRLEETVKNLMSV